MPKVIKTENAINLVITNGKKTARHKVTGRQVVRTIKALTKARAKGITALEVSNWAFRLASYIYKLRHIYGLQIETQSEPHDGGAHARYVLVTPVKLEAAP